MSVTTTSQSMSLMERAVINSVKSEVERLKAVGTAAIDMSNYYSVEHMRGEVLIRVKVEESCSTSKT